jgi:hypothetical protein
VRSGEKGAVDGRGRRPGDIASGVPRPCVTFLVDQETDGAVHAGTHGLPEEAASGCLLLDGGDHLGYPGAQFALGVVHVDLDDGVTTDAQGASCGNDLCVQAEGSAWSTPQWPVRRRPGR